MALVHLLAGALGLFLLTTGVVALLRPAAVREGYATTDAAVGAATALGDRGWRLAGATLALVGAALGYWALG